jgi:hypothetical protein
MSDRAKHAKHAISKIAKSITCLFSIPLIGSIPPASTIKINKLRYFWVVFSPSRAYRYLTISSDLGRIHITAVNDVFGQLFSGTNFAAQARLI